MDYICNFAQNYMPGHKQVSNGMRFVAVEHRGRVSQNVAVELKFRIAMAVWRAEL